MDSLQTGLGADRLTFPEFNLDRKLTIMTTCSSKKTVYLLICGCGLKYERSTIQAVRVPFCEHCSCICNKYLEAPVVHFLDKNHSPDYFIWTVIESVTSKIYCRMDTCKLLLQKKAFGFID